MNLYDYWNGKCSAEQLDTVSWSTQKYHEILCNEDVSFLSDYIQLPLLQRLSGIGLLCGTDWTKLFCNRFFYSRLDHSIGTALVVWHFTRSKKQTIASLLHDVSTPAFSHVTDFRNGDALNQESTEDLNRTMINEDPFLKELLERDGLNLQDVNDYHKYPVADNERPGLSADRLEYMYPSGAALDCVWNLEEIKKSYSSLEVLKNENGKDELGFISESEALTYTKKFCDISLLLQHNEDKASMQLMADVITEALKNSFICENDLYTKSEAELIEWFTEKAEKNSETYFAKLFKTFVSMKKVIHSEKKLENCWCVSLKVKQRYVDPLVKMPDGNCKRVSEINSEAKKIIKDFLEFKDSEWGCVPFAETEISGGKN